MEAKAARGDRPSPGQKVGAASRVQLAGCSRRLRPLRKRPKRLTAFSSFKSAASNNPGVINASLAHRRDADDR